MGFDIELITPTGSGLLRHRHIQLRVTEQQKVPPQWQCIHNVGRHQMTRICRFLTINDGVIFRGFFDFFSDTLRDFQF